MPEDVAYFNTANLAPQLHSVRRRGTGARPARRAVDDRAADWFSDVERLRALFGRSSAPMPRASRSIPATSYGFAVAARNLAVEAGERILVLAEEYPSGIYTWRRLRAGPARSS